MDAARAIRQLSRDGAALAQAAGADLSAPVPTCPGWNVRRVVGHTGAVYRWALAALDARTRPTTRERAPAEGDVLEWYVGLSRLVSRLRSESPRAAVWTWYDPDQTVGFWCRRMAHETLIHRADVEVALGGSPPRVDATVATDGIDEVLTVFLGFRADEVGGAGETVAVRTADSEWLVTLGEERTGIHRQPPDRASRNGGSQNGASGNAASRTEASRILTIAGTPSRVLYFLWGRLALDAVDVRGDTAVLGRLRAALAAATS